MFKRIFALVLTALLSLSVMTACAGNASSSQQSASSAAIEAPAASQTEEYTPSYPIVSEKVTFTAAVSRDNVGEHIWYKAYEEATNVAIDWQYWSDWQTQLGVALSGNEVPDLIFNFYSTGLDKAQALKYGQQKYFINYKDYLKYMPDLVALMDAHPESYKAVENDDGSMYALPAFLQTLTAFPGTLYYRTDMFQEAGIEAPKTTDDLLQATKDLQSYYGKDNKNFIAFQPYSSAQLVSQLLYFLFPSFGDEVDMELGSSDGKTVTYNYTSEQYRRLMEYMHELYTSGGFDKNIFSEDGTNAKAVLLANNAAITTFGTLYSADNFKSGNYDVDMLAPLTSEFSKAQKYTKPFSSRMAAFEISTKCSDIETLVKWVNALYTTEENEIAKGVSGISLWLGIRGETWNYDDDSKKTYTVQVPEGFDGSTTDYLNEYGFGNACNCIFMSLNSSGKGLLCKGNGTRDRLLPYSVDIFPKNYLSFTDDESTTLAENYTDINKFVAESQASFITTGVTDDSWNAYVAAIENMGIEQVLKVYQDSFDRYNA